jgi:hypothetical protein
MSSTWVTVELTRLVKDIVDQIYFEILFFGNKSGHLAIWQQHFWVYHGEL